MFSSTEILIMLGSFFILGCFVSGFVVGMIRQKEIFARIARAENNLTILKATTDASIQDLFLRVAVLESLIDRRMPKQQDIYWEWMETPGETPAQPLPTSSQVVKRKPGRPPKQKGIEAKTPRKTLGVS